MKRLTRTSKNLGSILVALQNFLFKHVMGGEVDAGFNLVLINLYFNYQSECWFCKTKHVKKEKSNVRRFKWKSNILLKKIE